MTATDLPRLGLIFLARKRVGFDPDWGCEMNGRVRAGLDRLGLAVIEPGVKIVDPDSLAAGVAECHDGGAEVLLALQTTMSDARLSRVLPQLWPDPLVLWATPENPAGDMISSCSLVGVHNWATNLAHLRHPFRIVYGAPDEAATGVDLRLAIRQAATVRRLKQTTLGIVGGQAPGFFHMAPDAAALQRTFGTQLQHHSLVQFLDLVAGCTDDEVTADVARVEELGLPHRDSSAADLPVASRLCLAMRRLFTEEGCGALGLRCWPELPRATGQWPYLGMVRLAAEGRPTAPEGDGDGALLMLIGQHLGFGAGFLTDWLEHDASTITCWHAGNLPFALAPPIGAPGGPVLAKHFNTGHPLVVESAMPAEQPVTIARLWNRDGRYLLTAAEGRTVPLTRRFMGSHARVQLADRRPHDWFLALCQAGMPHHVVLFPGHGRGALKTFAELTGTDWLD